MSLATIRAGIASNISGSVTTLQTYAYRPKSPQYPCAYVGQPITLDSGVTQGTARTTEIPVWVGLPWNDDASSDDLLEAFAESVPTAILSSRTLGGAAHDISIEAADGFDQEPMADGRVVQWFRILVTVFS